MPVAFQVGRFIRFYGPATYHNPARWPTADGVIPFGVMAVLDDAIDHVAAGEQLDAALAGQLGQLLAEVGKDMKVKRAVRKLQARANPRIHDEDDAAEEGDE